MLLLTYIDDDVARLFPSFVRVVIYTLVVLLSCVMRRVVRRGRLVSNLSLGSGFVCIVV